VTRSRTFINHHSSFIIPSSAFILLLLLIACSPPVIRTPGGPSVLISPPPATLTPAGPPPTPVCGDVTPAPPGYRLDLTLDYAAHVAQVSQIVTLVNQSTDTWRDLAFSVSANHAPDIFNLNAVAIDGYPANHALEDVGLRLILPAPLDSGCQLTVSLDYTLNLPRLDASALGWRGVLGWTPRQTLLGHWYPTLVPYGDGRGWLGRRPADQGEYETTEASDIAVRLALVGEATDLTISASAAPTQCPNEPSAPPLTLRPATCYALAAGRHFALALSDQMETSTTTAGEVTIAATYFPEHSTAGRATLRAAREAFAVYTRRFGPVPYTRLEVVEADIVDGMEFTGLFLLARPYYAEFDGSPQNYLTVITVHETAHLWWYSLVGNDPATEPWLDEALATYSEEIYFEAVYPELVEWWWSFRVWQYLPEGSVNKDIYASDEFRPYVNAVYLNGAQFVHALRGETGEAAFFDFLRTYAERGAGRIVTAGDFWQTYDEFGDAEGSAARREYFGGEE
jgi:hypothetical protein